MQMQIHMFSRLSLPVQPKEVPMPEELVLLLESLEISTVNVTQIKHWTDHDPVLTKVCRLLAMVGPDHLAQNFSLSIQEV